MQTDKPLISIIMAVYEPQLEWLREQLESLNAQTYPNLELIIRDDCSQTVAYTDIYNLVNDTITAFPYKIGRNDKNLGSNKTFEYLTLEARGEYIAYCDQDDVWITEKLLVLENSMTDEIVKLVCSDVQVIDSSGNIVADSITQIRHRHIFYSGSDNVFQRLLTRNFVIGCTMLVRRSVALSAVPFPRELVHDHWIALVAASSGTVLSLPQTLIRYRIHGGNQTGVLTGITSKHEYIDVRIVGFINRIQRICERFPQSPYTERVKQWAIARADYAKHSNLSTAVRLWKLRDENRATTIFELLTIWIPEHLFRYALRLAKRAG